MAREQEKSKRPAPEPGAIRDLYDLLTGDEDARVCKDIDDSACREQPRNFFLHIASLVATKTGDRLASPKLVLAWLLSTVGAPGFMTGLLVPIRESLALLPQLVVARRIREVPVRKWFWVGGSILQGLSVAGMALAVVLLDGAVAGWAILILLVVFSLARGICSVSSKDVLGKTIAKTRRGTVSGYAASAAGVATIAVGIYAAFYASRELPLAFFVGVLVIAAGLWLLAAAVYAFLAESPGATEGGGNALKEAIGQLELIRTDATLRNFVITRTLLLSTALVGPFYVTLAQQRTAGQHAGLGLMLIAAGVASFVSAPVWGRIADQSSKRVMTLAAMLAAATGLATFTVHHWAEMLAGSAWTFAAAYFLLSVAHGGVRIGRKTHVVDIATSENRASYVAVSNTVIGVMLLTGSVFGWVASRYGPAAAILVLSAMSVVAAASANQLEEAQR